MIRLKCIRDVIMNQDARVAFKAGHVYDFSMNAHGEISTPTSNGVHMFRASGPEAWTVYFKYELEGCPMKFSIGDKVKVIDSVFDLFTVGMVGTITAVTGDYLGPCYDVQQEGWEGYIGSWPMYEEELELIS